MAVSFEIVLMNSLHGTLVQDQIVEEKSYPRRNTKKMSSSHPNHHDHDDVRSVTQVPIQPETEHSQYHACRNVIMKQEDTVRE